MRLASLRIDGVRNLRGIELAPGERVNFLAGENGAGKTSCLEAIHCIALGRSFRSGPRHAWIDRSSGEARIFCAGDGHRLGVRQDRAGWEGRIDGDPCAERARFSSLLPLFVFHPDAHSLVEGEPLNRRRLVDQGAFHLQPAFLDDWRLFRRALSQRNAALRSGASDAALRPWERALAVSGERLTGHRFRYVRSLGDSLASLLPELGLRLPTLSLALAPGWPRGEALLEALERTRGSDRARGFTQLGPQRADLRIHDSDGRITGRLSRGQQKLVALALVVSQARLFQISREEPPLFLLDDVGSELDADHVSRFGRWLVQVDWQLWMTGIEIPQWLSGGSSVALFHVEQGAVGAVR